MQGKRIVKIDGREYLIERTLDTEAAVYVKSEGFVVGDDLHVDAINPEPGTLVIILARVAAPPPPVEIERRRYRDVHWEPVNEQKARRALGHDYGKNTDAVWRELTTGTVIGAGDCQYRRRET